MSPLLLTVLIIVGVGTAAALGAAAGLVSVNRKYAPPPPVRPRRERAVIPADDDPDQAVPGPGRPTAGRPAAVTRPAAQPARPGPAKPARRTAAGSPWKLQARRFCGRVLICLGAALALCKYCQAHITQWVQTLDLKTHWPVQADYVVVGFAALVFALAWTAVRSLSSRRQPPAARQAN